jgi:hypothetical protein
LWRGGRGEGEGERRVPSPFLCVPSSETALPSSHPCLPLPSPPGSEGDCPRGGGRNHEWAHASERLRARRGEPSRCLFHEVSSHLCFPQPSGPHSRPSTGCLQRNFPCLARLPSWLPPAQFGIHHIVLPAVLETPSGRDCFGRVEVFSDRLELIGEDTMMR